MELERWVKIVAWVVGTCCLAAWLMVIALLGILVVNNI